MKKFVKTAAFAVALILVAFSQQAMASSGPYHWYASFIVDAPSDNNKFSVELNRQDNEEVIYAVIDNPGRKNLSVTLSDPDGATIDNFYTGRKLVKMNKRYNFTGAEAGLYTLTISDGVERIKKQVKLERVFTTPVSRLIVQ